MRKQTKLVAVLSAAALLAIGASMTSFAATGWAQEDGNWVYYDNSGDLVTETWKKSGTNYFYLDEDGLMATSRLIEDDDTVYYVDENGARVINKWVSVDNDDIWDEEVDTVYYYFGSTGKAYEGKKSIGGKTYIFDDEGHMYSGWYEDPEDTEKKYYLGTENEGWAYTDWQFLEVDTDFTTGDYDDEEWFYFKSNGQAAVSTRRYINGYYYAFDDQGVMKDKWLIGTPATASPAAAFYNGDFGGQQTGWVKTYAQDDPDENGDPYWYYLNSKGIPFNYDSKALASAQSTEYDFDKSGWKTAKTSVAAKVIKSKTYLFDEDGKMLKGVQHLTGVKREGGSAGALDNGIYYFNKTSAGEGQMMTGKQTVNVDGDYYYYNFKKDGVAYTSEIVDGCWYGKDGKRINSDDGNQVFVLEENVSVKGGSALKAGDRVIVSTSGKVKKSGTVTIDGDKWEVKDYKATEKVETEK